MVPRPFLPLSPLPSPNVSKPKNQRVKRALEARAPKLVENTKSALFIRGGHTSMTVTQALKDMVGFVTILVM